MRRTQFGVSGGLFGSNVELRRTRKVPITDTAEGVHPFSAGSCTFGSAGSGFVDSFSTP